jgi:hypothetical protein
MNSKLSLMDLPNEILNHILHHLLKEARVNYGVVELVSELFIDPHRCKALCITEVNKKFFELAWMYLNTNCSITNTYLPKNPYEKTTRFHINRDGDMVVLNEIASFRQVTNLTLEAWQPGCLRTTAKHAHPLLIRFPKLQQITWKQNWEFPIAKGSGKETEVQCMFQAIANLDWWFEKEIINFLLVVGLLPKVEKRVQIRCTVCFENVSDVQLARFTPSNTNDMKGCTVMATKHGVEVLSVGYAKAALWKDLLEDVFGIQRLPVRNWHDKWLNGGSRHAKWASVK